MQLASSPPLFHTCMTMFEKAPSPLAAGPSWRAFTPSPENRQCRFFWPVPSLRARREQAGSLSRPRRAAASAARHAARAWLCTTGARRAACRCRCTLRGVHARTHAARTHSHLYMADPSSEHGAASPSAPALMTMAPQPSPNRMHVPAGDRGRGGGAPDEAWARCCLGACTRKRTVPVPRARAVACWALHRARPSSTCSGMLGAARAHPCPASPQSATARRPPPPARAAPRPSGCTAPL